MDDEVTERVDQPAKTLLAFLQFPHTVGERLDLRAAARGAFRHDGSGAVLGMDRPRQHREACNADCRQRDDEEIGRAGQARHTGQRDNGDDGCVG
jgi:hypothetical protein